MSQNLFAFVAKYLVGGGAASLSVDANGNLLTAPGAAAGQRVTSSSANQANAAAVATLPAVAGKTNYLAGMALTFSGATAAGVVTATVAGLNGGTQNYTVAVPAGATVGGTPIAIEFNPPIQASAANTAIVVTLPALGAGNTNATAVAWGYVQ